ncbi:MAG: TssN family type VI secretion system protein [Chitinophagaceae bacterium]
MTTKTFSFLAGIMAVIAVSVTSFLGKMSNSYSAKAKKPLVIALVASVGNALLAFCFTFLEDDDAFVLYWILMGLFLATGTVTLLLSDKFFVQEEGETALSVMTAQFLYILGIALLSAALFLVVIFFLHSGDFLYYPLLCSFLAFVAPLLFWYAYTAAMHVPYPVYKCWEYPNQEIMLSDNMYQERLLVIAFLLKKNPGDRQKTFFRAKAPESIRLGDLFYHFINDYNDVQSETPIHYLDEQDGKIQWWFRVKKKWFLPNSILDPTASVRENHITENTVIICEHIPKKV